MLLCDYIVFWRRHFSRPRVSENDLETYIAECNGRLLRICRNATARMLGRLKHR